MKIFWMTTGFAVGAAAMVACSNGGTLSQCYDTTTGQGVQCQDNSAGQPLSTEAKDIDGDGANDRFVCADVHHSGSDGDSDSDSDSDHTDGGLAPLLAKSGSWSDDGGSDDDGDKDGDKDSDSDSASGDDDHDGVPNRHDCDSIGTGTDDGTSTGGGVTDPEVDAGIVID
jgi:hypothetical protein